MADNKESKKAPKKSPSAQSRRRQARRNNAQAGIPNWTGPSQPMCVLRDNGLPKPKTSTEWIGIIPSKKDFQWMRKPPSRENNQWPVNQQMSSTCQWMDNNQYKKSFERAVYQQPMLQNYDWTNAQSTSNFQWPVNWISNSQSRNHEQNNHRSRNYRRSDAAIERRRVDEFLGPLLEGQSSTSTVQSNISSQSNVSGYVRNPANCYRIPNRYCTDKPRPGPSNESSTQLNTDSSSIQSEDFLEAVKSFEWKHLTQRKDSMQNFKSTSGHRPIQAKRRFSYAGGEKPPASEYVGPIEGQPSTSRPERSISLHGTFGYVIQRKPKKIPQKTPKPTRKYADDDQNPGPSTAREEPAFIPSQPTRRRATIKKPVQTSVHKDFFNEFGDLYDDSDLD